MTRGEALKKMQAVKSYMTSGNPIWSVTEIGEAFDMAIEALEQPERKTGKWIPCSERLPEESDLYCVSGKGKVWICEFHIIPNFIGGWRNDVSNPVVKAWIPLPEPYKEERKDDEQT